MGWDGIGNEDQDQDGKRSGWDGRIRSGTQEKDDWKGQEGYDEEEKSSGMRDRLVGPNLVDLRLQVLDHLLGHLVA